MYSRGKRMVELARGNTKDDVIQQEEIDSECSRVFSSDSDDDPTYYPSDNEFPDISRMKLNIYNSTTLESNVLNNSIAVQIASTSSYNSPPSPVYDVAPTITHVEELHSNDKILSKTKNLSKPRMPDFCYYCETEVLNFGRHIIRNHRQELEVQKIVSLDKNSLDRKRLIANLRKKGNFLLNSESLFKPVHKSYVNDTENNYIPCPFCFGIYSRKLLWKHKKKCINNKNPDACISLGEGQNLLLPKVNIDSNLKLKVFPRMMADKISLTAKKDVIICAYGARYLKTHREQHHINVCSRKMRELAKVLLESQKLNNKIKNLFDLLQPQYFDLIVSSVKVIAKYDVDKDIYLSPTFAMNISKSLKDCCDIAILHIVKRKYNENSVSAAEAEANLNMFVRLLETTWKFEISSQAGNDLNTKTWNKVTLIPLAADLKLFRQYLIEKGNVAEVTLKENMQNLKSFNLLMETIFCRLLLLNRKRVGELQRMKLHTYEHSEEMKTPNYEEFSDAITPTEKILLKSFKRVVIRGKRGRGVPVLFSEDIQNHMTLLLKARPNFLKTDNVFLFSNPKSNQPIVGYKILQKHAHLCGAKNPNALTSTKLRKHLATLTQVFNMTTNDIEQLATFMGHSINVHNKAYRLPDDVFQTAKIAKLLMLMEKGEAGKYKGKTLEEINLNMEEEIDNKEDDQLERDDELATRNNLDEELLDTIHENQENERPTQPTCTTNKEGKSLKRVLVPWTTSQRKTVLQFFKNHIKNKKPPKKDECNTLIKNNPGLLENKTWVKIKVFVQNHYTNKQKCNYSDGE